MDQKPSSVLHSEAGMEQMALFITQGYIEAGFSVHEAKRLTCRSIEDLYRKYLHLAQVDRPFPFVTVYQMERLVEILRDESKIHSSLIPAYHLAVDLLSSMRKEVE